MTDCAENNHKVLTGFTLATAAGMMTFIGALTVFFPIKNSSMRLASCFCLATASGVMTYVSLVEVFGESKDNFIEGLEDRKLWWGMNAEQGGLICATLTFFVGWLIALGMDYSLHYFMEVQRFQRPSGTGSGDETELALTTAMTGPIRLCEEEKHAQIKFESDTFRLVQVGWFTALALTLHNIPEGLLTYVSSLSENPGTGMGIACAIGLHNIPEGFAVAMPIYIGTRSKHKAMFYAGITGFAEPIGALIGYLTFGDGSSSVLGASNSKVSFGILFGLTAGIMTEVAIKSLLLEAARYDPTNRVVSTAWLLGAFVIAISLVVIDVTGGCEQGEIVQVLNTTAETSSS